MKAPAKLDKIKKLIETKAKKEDIEFDVFKDKDANNNEYYYFHFKPRFEKTELVELATKSFKKLKIKYAIPLCSAWKTLLFVPFNQKLNYLVFSEGEIYKVG